MKKNILKTLTAFIALILFTFSVNAVVRPTDDAARVPSKIPDPGAKLYATVQSPFDFSKIKFVNGSTETTGYDSMRKIVLTDKYEIESAEEAGKAGIGVGSDWFSAYCLDGRLKYPENGMYFIFDKRANMTDDQVLNELVDAALLNQVNSTKEMYALFKGLRSYKTGFTVQYTTPGYNSSTEAIAGLTESNPVTVEITRIVFASSQGQPQVITAEDLNKAANQTGDTFKLKLILKADENNTFFDLYTTTAMDNTLNYNRALWMIEHSYPSLSLKDSLTIAGASYDKLVTELKALDNTITDANAEKYAENYVYSTIQYAVWKVNDGVDMNGNTLGNTLKGSEELNKLYAYLIQDKGAAFYASYGKSTFTEKLSITKPESKKEIFEETNEVYKYGPFKVQGDFIETGKMYLTVKDADKNGVKLVNKNGDTITEVTSGDEFYVLANKKSKIANVTIEASAPEAKKFVPAGNRGRVYYANNALGQNVITGGKIETTATNQNFELLFNPSTGVENVGMLFMVTLIAFGIGYYVLTRKNQPVEL